MSNGYLQYPWDPPSLVLRCEFCYARVLRIAICINEQKCANLPIHGWDAVLSFVEVARHARKTYRQTVVHGLLEKHATLEEGANWEV